MEDSQKFMLLASKIKSLESKLSEATTKVSTVEKQIGPQGPRGDKGEPGKDGRDGRDGRDGSDGKDGADGSDGVGIESVEVTFDNSLVVRLTDGTEIDAGEINVRGEGSSGTSSIIHHTTSSFGVDAGTIRNYVFVSSLSDLPSPQSGVISLLDNYTYFFTQVVDLLGNRLVAGQNTTILGSSSENCRIKSTGLGALPLIASAWSLPMRGITLEAELALFLDAAGNPGQAIDWFGVNFTDCANVGVIKDYNNVIWTDCALLNSANLTFDGTTGTVGFNSSLFSGRAGQTTIIIPSTATITRRFRIIYSAFVTPSTGTALDVSTSATMPVEGYILDTVNHGGGGTATAGVPYTDNKALFVNCRGIPNSAEIANYYMNNNATTTNIVTTGVAVKVAGAVSSNPITQKFTITDNRATYTGAISRSFRIASTANITAAAQNLSIGMYVAKNGIVLPESEIYVTTNANNRAESVAIQAITELQQNDFIEVFVENETNNTDVTVTYLNVIIASVN